MPRRCPPGLLAKGKTARQSSGQDFGQKGVGVNTIAYPLALLLGHMQCVSKQKLRLKSRWDLVRAPDRTLDHYGRIII